MDEDGTRVGNIFAVGWTRFGAGIAVDCIVRLPDDSYMPFILKGSTVSLAESYPDFDSAEEALASIPKETKAVI